MNNSVHVYCLYMSETKVFNALSNIAPISVQQHPCAAHTFYTCATESSARNIVDRGGKCAD